MGSLAFLLVGNWKWLTVENSAYSKQSDLVCFKESVYKEQIKTQSKDGITVLKDGWTRVISA